MKKYLILAIALCINAIAANATELNVYPVPAVFTSKNINDTDFLNVLEQNRALFTQKYLSEFEKYFQNTSSQLSDKTKYKTFAAYVHVPRVSQYNVKKSEDLLDIYLPLTLSINFVNMATGETLYTYPVTNYFKYETR